MSGQDGGRRLRVYGVNLFVPHQARCIVAAPSLRAAAPLFGVSLHYLKTYGSETGNDREVRVATRRPGTVFVLGEEGAYSPLKPEEAPDGR